MSGFGSGLSLVIPAASDEDPAWLSELVAIGRGEANEILIVLEAKADLIAMRPAIGGFERVRLIFQRGQDKSGALNTGLQDAKNANVIFLDADVLLEPGQLSTVLGLLDNGSEFVSVAYGMRAPQIAASAFCSGWFFGARRSTFIEVGGWSEGFVEDVETGRKIQRSGHKITIAPFACKLRRPVRRPVTKFLSVLTSFGRK